MAKEIKINLGGEGEVPGVQVNGPWIKRAGWVGCDGRTTLADIQAYNDVVISNGTSLPFASNSAKVTANNVPIDCGTHLGEGYSSREITRVQKVVI